MFKGWNKPVYIEAARYKSESAEFTFLDENERRIGAAPREQVTVIVEASRLVPKPESA